MALPAVFNTRVLFDDYIDALGRPVLGSGELAGHITRWTAEDGPSIVAVRIPFQITQQTITRSYTDEAGQPAEETLVTGHWSVPVPISHDPDIVQDDTYTVTLKLRGVDADGALVTERPPPFEVYVPAGTTPLRLRTIAPAGPVAPTAAYASAAALRQAVADEAQFRQDQVDALSNSTKDAARLTTGLLPAARLGSGTVTKSKLASSVQDSLDKADAALSQTAATATYAAKANNLSDLASAPAARANLGLGSAATQPISAFDPAGAAAAIVGAAPAALDTLVEIATQLTSDESGAAALATLVGTKAPLASPAFTGTPTLNGGPFGGSSGAGLPSTIVNRTTAYTAAAGDFVLADTSTAGFTVTLPTAPATGALVAVKKTSADTNTLTIAPAGGGTVDGDTTATTVTKNAGLIVEHVGSNVWRVVASMTTTGPAGTNGTNGTNGLDGAISIIQDEGTALPVQAKLNFVGAGVTATNDSAGNRTTITIPGGGTGTGGAGYWFLGDGTDGAVTISTTVTPTRDMHYTDLTITSTGVLKPNGWRIFVRGALLVQTGGIIDASGGNAATGGGTASGNNQRPLGQATSGADANNTGAGVAPSALAGSGTSSLGGAGGTGGASGGNAGGTGGLATGTTWTTVPYMNSWKHPSVLFEGGAARAVTNNGLVTSGVIVPGAGGGSGATDGVGAGAGAGGAGGGFLLVNAGAVTNSGTIRANGGNGSVGRSNNGGGGGGGGGGVVFLNCVSFAGTTPTATGGTGGAGLGTGSAGAAGSDGTVHVYVVG